MALALAVALRVRFGVNEVSSEAIEEWKSYRPPKVSSPRVWNKALREHMKNVQQVLLKDRGGLRGGGKTRTNCWDAAVTQASQYLLVPGK